MLQLPALPVGPLSENLLLGTLRAGLPHTPPATHRLPVSLLLRLPICNNFWFNRYSVVSSGWFCRHCLPHAQHRNHVAQPRFSSFAELIITFGEAASGTAPALTRVAQWVGRRRKKQRDAGSIPSPGPRLGCRPGPRAGLGGRIWEAAHQCCPCTSLFVSLFLPPFPSPSK